MQQIECPKCNESFEFNDATQGIIKIKCPKCNHPIQITKKITDVTLSKQYRTFIEENNHLVIEKKLFDWGKLFATILAVMLLPAIQIFMWKNSDTLCNESFIIFLKRMYFSNFFGVLNLMIFGLIMFIFVCKLIDILLNTMKIIINDTDVDISVYPVKLPITVAKKIPAKNINQIFCKKIITKNNVRYCLIALNKDGGELALCTFDQLEEARALEILIEKRLGIEDRIVEDEALV